MPGKFNPDDYVPVNTRLLEFRKEHPEGRIVSTLLSAPGAQDIVIRADIYLGAEDVIVANGHAHEVVGQGMVNLTSAMENCETSAWGRALANLGYEIRKGIASREEMERVERGSGATAYREPPQAQAQASATPRGTADVTLPVSKSKGKLLRDAATHDLEWVHDVYLTQDRLNDPRYGSSNQALLIAIGDELDRRKVDQTAAMFGGTEVEA